MLLDLFGGLKVLEICVQLSPKANLQENHNLRLMRDPKRKLFFQTIFLDFSRENRSFKITNKFEIISFLLHCQILTEYNVQRPLNKLSQEAKHLETIQLLKM